MRLAFTVFGLEVWALRFDPDDCDGFELVEIDEPEFGFQTPTAVD